MRRRPLSSGSRGVRGAVRNPPGPRGPRATSDLARASVPVFAPPTYDLGAAVAAGILKAHLPLLVGPVPEARVLNLQGRDGLKSGVKSAAPPARPPAPRGADKGKQSLRAAAAPARLPLRCAPALLREDRATQTFLPQGPLGTR